MAFKLTTPAFADGGLIPKLHTCEGADISPSLEWDGEPTTTRGLALIMDDPDAPAGTWNHWLLYDLPPSVRSLAQGYKPGKLGQSGTNDFGRLGYGGPRPPTRTAAAPKSTRLCGATSWRKRSIWVAPSAGDRNRQTTSEKAGAIVGARAMIWSMLVADRGVQPRSRSLPNSSRSTNNRII